MTKEFLYQYISNHDIAVISSVNAAGDPESAVISIAVTKDLEIVFDTVVPSRKYNNILQHPQVSFVIPDGCQCAETWPGLVHFKINPHWIRYSNFNNPQVIEEVLLNP